MEATAGVVTPVQYAVLARLWEKGAVSQNELGRLAAMDPPTVHGVVRRLHGRGLVTSQRDPADRRLIVYRLTPAGRRLVRRLIPLEQAAADRTLAALTPATRHQLIELLRRVAWEPVPPLPGVVAGPGRQGRRGTERRSETRG